MLDSNKDSLKLEAMKRIVAVSPDSSKSRIFTLAEIADASCLPRLSKRWLQPSSCCIAEAF